jgi:hypothetical protein
VRSVQLPHLESACPPIACRKQSRRSEAWCSSGRARYDDVVEVTRRSFLGNDQSWALAEDTRRFDQRWCGAALASPIAVLVACPRRALDGRRVLPFACTRPPTIRSYPGFLARDFVATEHRWARSPGEATVLRLDVLPPDRTRERRVSHTTSGRSPNLVERLRGRTISTPTQLRGNCCVTRTSTSFPTQRLWTGRTYR